MMIRQFILISAKTIRDLRFQVRRYRCYANYCSLVYTFNFMNYVVLAIDSGTGINLSVNNAIYQVIVGVRDLSTNKLFMYYKSSLSIENYIIAHAISLLSSDISLALYDDVNYAKLALTDPNCEFFKIVSMAKPITEVFAIINYTPDSFSDGGNFNNPDLALLQIERQIEAGVTIIDLGVESTRPDAKSISHEQELDRLKEIVPIVVKYRDKLQFKLSIDTYHSENIPYLLDFGVDIINDVSGNIDQHKLKLIAQAGKTYVAMHNLGVPANSQVHFKPADDVVKIIYDWMQKKLTNLLDLGFSLDQIILDFGLGFGLLKSQNWQILQSISVFTNLSVEILCGHSRKGMLKLATKSTEKSTLDALSSHIAVNLVAQHVDYVRLHEASVFFDMCRVNHLLGV